MANIDRPDMEQLEWLMAQGRADDITVDDIQSLLDWIYYLENYNEEDDDAYTAVTKQTLDIAWESDFLLDDDSVDDSNGDDRDG